MLVLYVLRARHRGLFLRKSVYYCGAVPFGSLGFLRRELDRHNAGLGSSWTQRYGKWECIESYKIEDLAEVTTATASLMRAHGIGYVRGGPWSDVALTEDDIRGIVRCVGIGRDLCRRCSAPTCTHTDGACRRTFDKWVYRGLSKSRETVHLLGVRPM